MESNKIYIRNMVCPRCVMAVRTELARLGIEPVSVELGEVTLKEALSVELRDELSAGLDRLGFGIIDDRRSRTIEQVRTAIIELVHRDDGDLRVNLSDYIARRTGGDYHYISALFSEATGTTVEKYFIAQKIERVKELLVYDELTLSEIAYKLNYSSPAHLSAQFKKMTGLAPSHYKNIGSLKRKPLDEV